MIEKRGNKWVVVAESTGKVLGSHASKDSAVRQLQAIEASKHRREGKRRGTG